MLLKIHVPLNVKLISYEMKYLKFDKTNKVNTSYHYVELLI